MIPLIEAAATKYGWMTTEQLVNMVAIAGMSPGPIAANSAILVGYSAAGVAGAVTSAAAILLPAIMLVVVVASFFLKLHHHPVVESMFYGLKPIVTSLIIFAAVKFAQANHLVTLDVSFQSISMLLIFGLSLFALMKLRWNPVYVIIISGLVGIALYS